MGGGEINLHLLAKALVKQGVGVSVLTSYHKGLQRYEIVDGIHVYRTCTTGESPIGIRNNIIRSVHFPKSIDKEVLLMTRRKKFDIIHFIGTSCIAAPKLNHLEIPLCATVESYPALCPKGDRIFHGKKECMIRCSPLQFISCQQQSVEIGKMKNIWYFKYNPLFLWYVYRYYTKLQKSLQYCNLIAISKYVQGILHQHKLQSIVIPNALAVHEFRIKNKNKDRKSKKVEVVYLGSLIKSKGPQILLRALRELDCHCTLYGDGVLKEELVQFINKNKLNATLHEPVSYSQIPAIYDVADIVVFPSLWPEPFGRISIESMAAGKPVIGSSIGGIKETIEKCAGILVQPGNIQELHTTLKTLIEKPDQRKKMGIVGMKKVLKYDENSVIQQLITTYKTYRKIKSIKTTRITS